MLWYAESHTVSDDLCNSKTLVFDINVQLYKFSIRLWKIKIFREI